MSKVLGALKGNTKTSHTFWEMKICKFREDNVRNCKKLQWWASVVAQKIKDKCWSVNEYYGSLPVPTERLITVSIGFFMAKYETTFSVRFLRRKKIELHVPIKSVSYTRNSLCSAKKGFSNERVMSLCPR